MGKLRLVPGRRVDELDGEFVVLDVDEGVVHRLTGPSADAYRRVREGSLPGDIDPASRPAVAGLIDLGLVEAEAGGISRRHVLQSGVTLAAVGVFTLSLPTAAQASSHVEGDSSLTITSATFRTGNDIDGHVSYATEPDSSSSIEFDLLDSNAGEVLRSNIARLDGLSGTASVPWAASKTWSGQPSFQKGRVVRGRLLSSQNLELATHNRIIE